MVLLTAEFFCGVNNDIASSRGCRHGRHGFPSRLPRVATSTVQVGRGPPFLKKNHDGLTCRGPLFLKKNHMTTSNVLVLYAFDTLYTAPSRILPVSSVRPAQSHDLTATAITRWRLYEAHLRRI